MGMSPFEKGSDSMRILAIMLVLLISSCSSLISEEDMLGIWRCEDRASLTMTFYASGKVELHTIYATIEGVWKLEDGKNILIVYEKLFSLTLSEVGEVTTGLFKGPRIFFPKNLRHRYYFKE